MESPLLLIALLDPFMPAATAIIFTAHSDRHRPLRDLLRRQINPCLIRPGGYALILLTIPLLTLAATGFDQLLGGNSGWSQTAIGVAGNPLVVLGLGVQLLRPVGSLIIKNFEPGGSIGPLCGGMFYLFTISSTESTEKPIATNSP